MYGTSPSHSCHTPHPLEFFIRYDSSRPTTNQLSALYFVYIRGNRFSCSGPDRTHLFMTLVRPYKVQVPDLLPSTQPWLRSTREGSSNSEAVWLCVSSSNGSVSFCVSLLLVLLLSDCLRSADYCWRSLSQLWEVCLAPLALPHLLLSSQTLVLSLSVSTCIKACVFP